MKKTMITGLLILWTATNVLADDAETNKKILKDALIGAVTGAVATEATKDGSGQEGAAESDRHVTDDKDHRHHGKPKKTNFTKKKKEKKRPYGWDQGKKTGWGDSDVPPGLAKKD